jgi:hypothetical protein
MLTIIGFFSIAKIGRSINNFGEFINLLDVSKGEMLSQIVLS